MLEELEALGIYMNISRRIFQDAIFYFKNEEDFAECLSSSPMSPDYTLAENKEEFKSILQNSYINGKIGMCESKQIWRAVKL